MTAWLSHSCDQASLSILKALVWSSSHDQNANCLTQFHTLCAFSITVLRNVLEELRKVQFQVHRANKQVATVYLLKIQLHLVRVICRSKSNRGKWHSSVSSSLDFKWSPPEHPHHGEVKKWSKSCMLLLLGICPPPHWSQPEITQEFNNSPKCITLHINPLQSKTMGYYHYVCFKKRTKKIGFYSSERGWFQR